MSLGSTRPMGFGIRQNSSAPKHKRTQEAGRVVYRCGRKLLTIGNKGMLRCTVGKVKGSCHKERVSRTTEELYDTLSGRPRYRTHLV